MDKEIVQAFIGAGGTIIAAVVAAAIAAYGAKRIAKSVISRFRTYGDKSHNVVDLLVHAQNDVFIVAAVGDRLLEKHKDYIQKLLNNGVRIRYLLLTEGKLKEAEEYIHGRNIDISFRKKVIDDLKSLESGYKGLFEYREFDSSMTASYICVDIMPQPPSERFEASSAIQIMLYQYKTKAAASPITYISPQIDEKVFKTTVDSIREMWNDAK